MRKFLLAVFVMFLVLLLFLIGYFIYSGNGGYSTTLVFYISMLLGIYLFVKNRVLLINLLAIVTIVFGFETYLRLFKESILDYNENNHKGKFTKKFILFWLERSLILKHKL